MSKPNRPKSKQPPNERARPERRCAPASAPERSRRARRRSPSPAPFGQDERDEQKATRIAWLREEIGRLGEELAGLSPEEAVQAAQGVPSPSSRGETADRASAPGAPASQAEMPLGVGVAESAVAAWSAPVTVRDATRELLTSDYFVRQWGRLGVRQRSEGRDEFGLDDDVDRRFAPALKLLFRNYFRAEVDGVGRIPSEGRCLVVANHSGGPVPYDGLLLRTALRLEHPAARPLRWLTEDLFHHLPWLGPFMTRLGAVRACQENAQRLLRRGYVVAVFPEGARGVGKPYARRYRLERFGRGGFVRLCIRTQTPLVPCAVVGAEDANPLLYRIENATRFLGVPYLPITPTFPWLGPLGLIPGPAKLTIRFGEPMSFEDYGPESADDELLVGRLSERVRTTIQGLLDETLSRRRSVFFG